MIPFDDSIPFHEIQIPSSVLDLVNARVADLSEEERDLLDVACCWGFEFDPVVVGDALGLGRIPALKRLGQIERLHRLVRSRGRTYAFDHHQVQEALYSALNDYLREEYHAALAESQETRMNAADKDPETLDGALCVDLCEHYLKGARGENALRYLPAAQAHLSTAYQYAQIVELGERALAIPGLLSGGPRAKSLLRVAGALDAMGRRVRQEECVQEAQRLAEDADDDELRGKAAFALGGVFSATSRNSESEAAFRHAQELAGARGDRRSEGRAMGSLGRVFASLGRLPEAKEHYERHISLAREIGDREGEAVTTGNLGNVFFAQGRYSEARQFHERHLALAREIGHREGEANATANVGLVFLSQGRFAEAQEYLERALAFTRESGRRGGEATATGNLGNVFWSQGRLPEAQEHFERALALSRENGDRLGEAIATGNLGSVLKALGRRAEAREQLERYLALSREIGQREGEAIGLVNLALVEQEDGRPARAEKHLLAGLAVCEEIGFGSVTASTHLSLGSLRAREGDEERARESLVAARDLATELGLLGTVTLARTELALLPGGDPADALVAFTESEERLDAGERLLARHLLWRATGDGSHLDEAKRLLDESLAAVPPEYHESILTNVRLNREIMAAWNGESGADTPDVPDDDDEPRGTESITRVG